MAEARTLLRDLGALDDADSLTEHGRALAGLPLHPRLAHMLTIAGPTAAPLAALLEDRDPLRGAGADLSTRLHALTARNRAPGLDRIRAEAKRLQRMAGSGKITDPGEQAALAYPDRIALRRPGNEPRWLLSGGKGAKMDAADSLAGTRLLVVTDTDGHPRDATIRTALPITETALREVLGDRIRQVDIVEWSRREARVIARQEQRLGEIALASQHWAEAPNADVARAMLTGIRQIGLSLTGAAALFLARVELARSAGHDLPDMSDTALMDSLEDWLLSHLGGVRTAAQWKSFDVLPALRARLDWSETQLLDRITPRSFETPLGRKIDIDYSGEAPEISLRLQEMFGMTQHPVVAGRPLRVTLLSPAGRAVQTTMDIPNFWATSYADVRKDMRGRYPRHPWPEDPTVADPTLRAKPRGT
jgi:ATP-dependent helicase HrpB